MSKFHDEFFRQKGPKHDELVMKCVSPGGQKELLGWINTELYIQTRIQKYQKYVSSYTDRVVKFDGLATDYETEVLCKKGSFILGYADVVFSLRLYIEDYDKPIDVAIFIVEAKPELSDVGAVLRQLKTYRDILDTSNHTGYTPARMLIATYSNVPDDVRAYLDHEGVKVVTFPSP